MAQEYYTLVTDIGIAKFTNAQITQTAVNLTYIAVGDGEGSVYNPTQDQTALKNERWRGQVSTVAVDGENENYVNIETTIPGAVGGWMIREAGVFDDEGDLILISKQPETFKPTFGQGSVKDMIIKLVMELSNTDVAAIKIDPTIITASQQYVDTKVDEVNQKIDEIPTPINVLNTPKKVRYIAHRGLSGVAPENTLPAYEMAGKVGMWGAECDVMVTSDGHWILMHDDTVDRTTNGVGRVSDMTLAQIKTLTVDGGSNAAFYPGLRVPTLEEYLAVCQKTSLVPVIEIKSANNVNDYDTFVNALKSFGFEESAIVISFSLAALQAVRARSSVAMQFITTITESNINIVKQLGNAGLDVNVGSVNSENLQLAHKNNILVNTWTVNDLNTTKKLVDMGIDYITTDIIGGVE